MRGGGMMNRGGGGFHGGSGGPGAQNNRIFEKLQSIQGPTFELPALSQGWNITLAFCSKPFWNAFSNQVGIHQLVRSDLDIVLLLESLLKSLLA
jgi:hypothetical protein